MLRDSLPDVMALMDYHGISGLMECNTAFSPILLREFYATVHFSEKPREPRKMIWMSGGIKCEASLAEFGELFDIVELPFQPLTSMRIHVDPSKLMKAQTGIAHCYPTEVGTLHCPKAKYFTPFWKAVQVIMKNTIHASLGRRVRFVVG